MVLFKEKVSGSENWVFSLFTLGMKWRPVTSVAASDTWTMNFKYLIIIVIQDDNGTNIFLSYSSQCWSSQMTGEYSDVNKDVSMMYTFVEMLEMHSWCLNWYTAHYYDWQKHSPCQGLYPDKCVNTYKTADQTGISNWSAETIFVKNILPNEGTVYGKNNLWQNLDATTTPYKARKHNTNGSTQVCPRQKNSRANLQHATMMTVFWDTFGPIHIDLLSSGIAMTAITSLSKEHVQKSFITGDQIYSKKGRYPSERHYIGIAQKTINVTEEMDWEVLQHQYHSIDLPEICTSLCYQRSWWVAMNMISKPSSVSTIYCRGFRKCLCSWIYCEWKSVWNWRVRMLRNKGVKTLANCIQDTK